MMLLYLWLLSSAVLVAMIASAVLGYRWGARHERELWNREYDIVPRRHERGTASDTPSGAPDPGRSAGDRS